MQHAPTAHGAPNAERLRHYYNGAERQKRANKMKNSHGINLIKKTDAAAPASKFNIDLTKRTRVSSHDISSQK